MPSARRPEGPLAGSFGRFGEVALSSLGSRHQRPSDPCEIMTSIICVGARPSGPRPPSLRDLPTECVREPHGGLPATFRVRVHIRPQSECGVAVAELVGHGLQVLAISESGVSRSRGGGREADAAGARLGPAPCGSAGERFGSGSAHRAAGIEPMVIFGSYSGYRAGACRRVDPRALQEWIESGGSDSVRAVAAGAN